MAMIECSVIKHRPTRGVESSWSVILIVLTLSYCLFDALVCFAVSVEVVSFALVAACWTFYLLGSFCVVICFEVVRV
jgi:hypothetical protein